MACAEIFLGSTLEQFSISLKAVLLIPLALLGLYFVWVLFKSLTRLAKHERVWPPSWKESVTGFVTNFFDALGIGSFAPTTAIFRAWRLVPDEIIPGTLNVGHTLPAVISAFIFIELVPVASGTLLPMIIAAVLGAWLGAGVVAGLSRYRVRFGMGMALIVAAGIMLMTQLKLIPGGGEALGLSSFRLAIAVAGNFILGALMTLGIGLYAPCMIIISLLGMNPLAAFPIMMGSCAFLMPVGSVRFVRKERYHPRAAIGLFLGGIPALLIAALIVKSLPIGAVRWLVIVVVLYTSMTLLRAARLEREQSQVGQVAN